MPTTIGFNVIQKSKISRIQIPMTFINYDKYDFNLS